MHPVVHPHEMISEHAVGMVGRERSRGTNYPSLRSQPISVTVERTGEGTWPCIQTLAW